jgi:hypothetical protein
MKIKSLGARSLKPFLAVGTIAAMLLSSLPGIYETQTAQAAVAGHVVISEVYGGGGNSGSTWKNDFIELYNPTDTAVSLSGWTVQYASASGSFTLKTNLSGSIGSHKYYLIQEAAGTGGTQNLPTPDATGSISMSATSAKVALTNSTVTVTGPTGANVVDFVGYGTSASQYEGSGRAPAPSNTTSIERKANDGTDPTTVGEGKGNGWDDNNNATDFVVRSSVAPQNSASPAEPSVQVPVTGVTLNKTSTTIGIGQQETLVATVQPSDATNKNVTWSTNNASVATVSATGVVTGVSVGTAIITVTTQDGGYTANCTVTVTAAPTYNFYYGQLHNHTNYSDGTGTPDQAYDYARNTGHADFFAITDHSNWFDNDLDWTKSVEWANLKQSANNHNVDGQFVALAAFEMTWSNGTGHINTFDTDWFESRNNSSMDLQNYYNRIAADNNSISQWNHPGTTFGDFQNFGLYNSATDQVMNLIEVANGSGPVRGSGYYPSYEYYHQALDKGWHVAPTIGQDVHNGQWITCNEARTVVLAPSLTRANIYDALKYKRVYATEDRNLRLMYTVNGSIMGSILSNPSNLNIVIDVTDPDAGDNISKIEILANGDVVVAFNNFSSNTAHWAPTLNTQYKYYYVKVTMANGDYAFSAPVWTGL